jgi:hypothetical protein
LEVSFAAMMHATWLDSCEFIERSNHPVESARSFARGTTDVKVH